MFYYRAKIGAILNTSLDVIDMVKQLKQHYIYNGKQYKLPKLKKFVCFDDARNMQILLRSPLLHAGIQKHIFSPVITFIAIAFTS